MNAEEIFINLAKELEEVSLSKMFGKPCYKINGKAFTCFFDGEMAFKLNKEDVVNGLKIENAKLFDPSGKNRPMKEWVQIPYLNLELWRTYTLKSLENIKKISI